jgi:hypothetical protein
MTDYKRKINDLENKARGMQPGSVDFINTMNEVNKNREAYEEIESSTFNGIAYDNRIKEIDKEIADAKAGLAYFEDKTAHPYKKYNEKGEIKDYTMSEAEAKALEDTRSIMSNENTTYGNNVKVYKARIDENEVNKYKRSLDYQKAVAVQTEAVKNANSAASTAPKAGGAGGNPGGAPKGGK